MKDIKLSISKPYSSSNDSSAVKPIMFEFSCLFDDPDTALNFQQELGALVIKFRKGDSDAR